MSYDVKLIKWPRVYLVGSQAVDENSMAAFLEDNDALDWTTDTLVPGEILAETAGRLCYMSYAKPRPGGNKAYLGHILEVGHGSVLEHAVYNLIITGVSRSFTHELVRHRAGFGFSQLSQRYVDESDVAFVVPPALADEIEAGRLWEAERRARGLANLEQTVPERVGFVWLDGLRRSMTAYSELSDALYSKFHAIPDKTARRKMAREAARSVLPNCTETKIFVTANARALRHFIEMRGNAAADAEIRRVAVAILRLMAAESPNIFGDYSIKPCPLGGEEVSTPFRKV